MQTASKHIPELKQNISSISTPRKIKRLNSSVRRFNSTARSFMSSKMSALGGKTPGMDDLDVIPEEDKENDEKIDRSAIKTQVKDKIKQYLLQNVATDQGTFDFD